MRGSFCQSWYQTASRPCAFPWKVRHERGRHARAQRIDLCRQPDAVASEGVLDDRVRRRALRLGGVVAYFVAAAAYDDQAFFDDSPFARRRGGTARARTLPSAASRSGAISSGSFAGAVSTTRTAASRPSTTVIERPGGSISGSAAAAARGKTARTTRARNMCEG